MLYSCEVSRFLCSLFHCPRLCRSQPSIYFLYAVVFQKLFQSSNVSLWLFIESLNSFGVRLKGVILIST